MQIKTSAIILNTHKHTDKSTIVNAYSRHYGRISFAVYGTHGKKSVVRPAHLQPLTLVEIDLQHIPGRDLHRVKDLRIEYIFSSIPFDPVKSSIALFIAEMLSKILRQPAEDEPLFDFLKTSIIRLDELSGNNPDFHLIFLLRLTDYLGFSPNTESNETAYFDLMNGVFEKDRPSHTHYISGEYAGLFRQLLNPDAFTTQNMSLTRATRKAMLNSILEYYRLHVPEFHGLHSLAVFQSLFD